MAKQKTQEEIEAQKLPQVIVTMRCVVTKIVVCEGCTPEEARAEPWDYAVDETEVEQIDWEVVKVEMDE